MKMQNEIVDAVIGRLKELFENEYPVHAGQAEQGTKSPCFFVGISKAETQPMLGRRCLRTWELKIQFQPGESGEPGSRQMNLISDRLLDEMEDIVLTDGTLMRGTNRSGEISEGILTFLIRFRGAFVSADTPADPMERMELKGEIP